MNFSSFLTYKKSIIKCLICLVILIIVFWQIKKHYHIFEHIYRYHMVNIANTFGNVIRNISRAYKYKIVIFRSINYDIMPDYFIYHNEILEKYCTMHGYTLEIFNHKEVDMNPYWMRVQDLIKLSKKYDENTIFIYMDIDTIINPKHLDKEINKLLYAYDTKTNNIWDIYLGIDLDHIVNTGIIIVKNTEWSKSLLNKWYSQYKPHNWSFDLESRKWSYNHNGRISDFATHGYEQGELNKLMMDDIIDYKNNMAILHYSWLSNRDIDSMHEIFIYHFYSNDDNEFKNKNIKKIYKSQLKLSL